ncbi:phosphate transporter PHO1 homolog 10-like isoform X4 [Malus domestica]
MLIVDNSNLGSSDEVTNLLERVETTFIQKNFILKSQGRFLFWLLGCEREHREKKRILYFLIGKMQRFTNIEDDWTN